MKSHVLVKKLTVCQLKVELGSLHKLKFYPSVLLLMIKMSQSACEKLDSYCKISLLFFYLIQLLLSGYLQFNGNFVRGQNNSKCLD